MGCYLSLLLLRNFGLKSAPSDMSIDIPACFHFPFAWSVLFPNFRLSLWVYLPVIWIFAGRKQLDFVFLVQFAHLCLFIGEMKSLIFIFIIEMYILIPVIFIYLLYLMFCLILIFLFTILESITACLYSCSSSRCTIPLSISCTDSYGEDT